MPIRTTVSVIAALCLLGGAFTSGMVVQYNSCQAGKLVEQTAYTNALNKAIEDKESAEAESLTWRDAAERSYKVYEENLNEERATNQRLVDSVGMRDPGAAKTCSIAAPRNRKTSTNSTGTSGTGTGVFSAQTAEFLLAFAAECDQVADNARLMQNWLKQVDDFSNQRRSKK